MRLAPLIAVILLAGCRYELDRVWPDAHAVSDGTRDAPHDSARDVLTTDTALADAPVPCTPATCAGCCAGDTCILFKDQSTVQCGNGGAPCALCPTYSSICQAPACEQGICIKVPAQGAYCTANTGLSGHCDNSGVCCTGCLQSDYSCRPGTQDNACGLLGAKCKDCKKSEECSNGVCVPE